MNKTARTKAKDPNQEKVRSSKETWNKEVSSFIDDIIHFKKYINGYPSKFNLEKTRITNDMPIEPSQILSKLTSEYEDLAHKSLELYKTQHEYVSGRNVKHASSKPKRFFSYLKGPFFGSDPETLKNRYRKNFLSYNANIYDSFKQIDSNILQKNVESISHAKTAFNKMSEDLGLLISLYNMVVAEFYTPPKELKEESKPESSSNPVIPKSEVAKPVIPTGEKKKEEAPNPPGSQPSTADGKEKVKPTKKGPKDIEPEQPTEPKEAPTPITTKPAPVITESIVPESSESKEEVRQESSSSAEPNIPTEPVQDEHDLLSNLNKQEVKEEAVEVKNPPNLPSEESKSEEKENNNSGDFPDISMENTDITVENLIQTPRAIQTLFNKNNQNFLEHIKTFYGKDSSKLVDIYSSFFSTKILVNSMLNIKKFYTLYTLVKKVEEASKNQFDFKDITSEVKTLSEKLPDINQKLKTKLDSVSSLKQLLDSLREGFVMPAQAILSKLKSYRISLSKKEPTEDDKKQLNVYIEGLRRLELISSSLNINSENNPIYKMINEVLYSARASFKTGPIANRDYADYLKLPLLSPSAKIPDKISDYSNMEASLLIILRKLTNTEVSKEQIQQEIFKTAGIIDNTMNAFRRKIHEFSFFDKTSPIRLKVSDLAKEGKSITDKVMDSIHSTLDIGQIKSGIEILIRIQTQMYNLLEALANVSRNHRLSRTDIKSLLDDRYFYDSDYSDKDLSLIDRRLNERRTRGLL